MSAALLDAQLVAVANRAVRVSAVALEPTYQRRAKVEVERGVVVTDLDHAPVDDVGAPVGDITLAQDFFVPVRKRRSTGLGTDESGPRALARRLIKMAVNYYVTRFGHRTPSVGSARPARHRMVRGAFTTRRRRTRL